MGQCCCRSSQSVNSIDVRFIPIPGGYGRFQGLGARRSQARRLTAGSPAIAAHDFGRAKGPATLSRSKGAGPGFLAPPGYPS